MAHLLIIASGGVGSAAAHQYAQLPDVLAILARVKASDYRLQNPFSPDQRPQQLELRRHGQATPMVKTNTFNGVQLPDITLFHSERDELETLRRFDYADFRDRLA